MIEIRTLAETPFKQIHHAFAKAFSDYVEPFDLTEEQLKYMVERRGCRFDLSFGAFNNEELVGITLNGIGMWEGKLTAYDTGTGIIKEFRKHGIASGMFNESLPILRENNIVHYLLEVIKTNTAAVDLYKKAGFNITREFDYYMTEKKNIKSLETETNNKYDIKKIDAPDWELFKSFWDFQPSWQNSIDSIKRKLPHFEILGIFTNDELAGYGIIEKHTGDIPQLAISKKQRRKGLATKLFYNLIGLTDNENIKIINTEYGYVPFKRFAEKIEIPNGHGQYEMVLNL